MSGAPLSPREGGDLRPVMPRWRPAAPAFAGELGTFCSGGFDG